MNATYERHPISAEHKDLQGSEWEEFLDGMRLGLLDLKITLHDGMILDGWQRYRGCLELGLTPVFQEKPDGITPRQFVKLVNINRRHESKREKKNRISKRRDTAATKRAEGKSLRTIAEEEGVDEKQIRRDLEKTSGADKAAVRPKDGKITGRDGRIYAARESLVDDSGAPVPRALEAAFTIAKVYRSARHHLLKVATILVEIEGSAAYKVFESKQDTLSRRRYSSACRTAAHLLESWRPAAVCAACQGAGCEACGKKGWLSSEETEK